MSFLQSFLDPGQNRESGHKDGSEATDYAVSREGATEPAGGPR